MQCNNTSYITQTHKPLETFKEDYSGKLEDLRLRCRTDIVLLCEVYFINDSIWFLRELNLL